MRNASPLFSNNHMMLVMFLYECDIFFSLWLLLLLLDVYIFLFAIVCARTFVYVSLFRKLPECMRINYHFYVRAIFFYIPLHSADFGNIKMTPIYVEAFNGAYKTANSSDNIGQRELAVCRIENSPFYAIFANVSYLYSVCCVVFASNVNVCL